MDQNQIRSGLKHVKTIRNILSGTSIENEAAAQIEKHLSGIDTLFQGEIERQKKGHDRPAKIQGGVDPNAAAEQEAAAATEFNRSVG